MRNLLAVITLTGAMHGLCMEVDPETQKYYRSSVCEAEILFGNRGLILTCPHAIDFFAKSQGKVASLKISTRQGVQTHSNVSSEDAAKHVISATIDTCLERKLPEPRW